MRRNDANFVLKIENKSILWNRTTKANHAERSTLASRTDEQRIPYVITEDN